MMSLRSLLLAAVLATPLACAQGADAPRTPTAGPGVHVIATPLRMPGLGRDRTLRIYLPPGYETSGKRYPVLYMHDGQNLFDDATSFVGEWGVDEAMDALAKEGLEVIVVGVDHGNARRTNEMMPLPHPDHGDSEMAPYLAFIVEVAKPWVDAHYRTRPGREDTGIMGSSMGGLASHYALYQYPAVFSKAGIFSPSYWITRDAVYAWTAARSLPAGDRVVMVAGDREGDDMSGPFRKMEAQWNADPKAPARHVELVPGGEHNERFWRAHFPDAVRFLFAPAPAPAVAPATPVPPAAAPAR